MKNLTLALIVVFILLGAIVVIAPTVASITSTPLNNNDTTAKIWAGNSGAYIKTAESISVSPNPTSNEIWTPGATDVYVISVPQGSLFSQSIVPQIVWSSPNKPVLSDLTNWFLYGQLYYNFTPYIYSSGTFGSTSQVSYTNFTASGVFNDGSGYVGFAQGSFPVNWNSTQTNINAAFGILTVTASITFKAESVVNGVVLSGPYYGHATTFAQIYVVPGTSTINPIKTVLAGENVYITGTIWYGEYTLAIYNPSGAMVYNTTLPQITNPYPNDFNVTYKTPPNVYGQYRVKIYNYVVQTSEEQFFSVARYNGTSSGFLPLPTITLSNPNTLSGYYNPNTVVTYTIKEKFNHTQTPPQTIYFNINIWIGSQVEEPPSSSASWITFNVNATAVKSAVGNVTIFTYTGTFIIPYSASNNYITIDVVAVGENNNGAIYASQPAIVELSIGQPTHHGGKDILYAVLEMIGFIVSGLVAAYLDPDTIVSRIMVFSSALFSAILVYVVNIAGVL